MPCLAANFSARARSRAATATTSTPSTSRAGLTQGRPARCAPRRASRSAGVAIGGRLAGDGAPRSGEAGDEAAPAEDRAASARGTSPRGSANPTVSAAAMRELAPVEPVAVDEATQRGERVRRGQRERDRLQHRRAARRPGRRSPTAASPRTSRPTRAPRRREPNRSTTPITNREIVQPTSSSTAAIGTRPNPSVETSNE